MRKDRVKLAFAINVAVTVWSYTFGAFVNWDMFWISHLPEWSNSERGFAMICTTTVSVVVWAMTLGV